MPTTDDRDADDPAVERRRALGDLLVSMREFSIFVTKTIEIFADGPIPSDAEMVAMICVRLDGPTRPGELAQVSGLTTGGVTNLLDRSEEAGLLSRHADVEGDRRVVVVELTPAGVAAVKRYTVAYARSSGIATPILRQWKSLFAALGHDVGAMRPWGGGQPERCRADARTGRCRRGRRLGDCRCR